MFEESAPKKCLKILVANKIDLLEMEQVRFKHAKQYAREEKFEQVYEISAKNGQGVEEMVQSVA